MIYLPDTNVWIAYLNPDNLPVKVHFHGHPVEDIGISIAGIWCEAGQIATSQKDAS